MSRPFETRKEEGRGYTDHTGSTAARAPEHRRLSGTGSPMPAPRCRLPDAGSPPPALGHPLPAAGSPARARGAGAGPRYMWMVGSGRSMSARRRRGPASLGSAPPGGRHRPEAVSAPRCAPKREGREGRPPGRPAVGVRREPRKRGSAEPLSRQSRRGPDAPARRSRRAPRCAGPASPPRLPGRPACEVRRAAGRNPRTA